MENVAVLRLKKGLSKIKKSLNQKIGPVYKLNKGQVINKLQNLGYNYDLDKQELRVTPSKSMTRKVNSVKI